MAEMMELFTHVSFAETPLEEITSKHEAIVAAGWQPRESRGDPWAAGYSKYVPEDDPDPERELREIMGDYWLGPDAIRALFDK